MSCGPSYLINIDARGSSFYNIGGDQNNYTDITDQLAVKRVRHTSIKRLRHHSVDNISMSREDGSDGDGEDNVLQIGRKRRKLSHDTRPCGREFALQWPTGSAGEVADNLIIKIVQLLVDRGDTGDYYRRLELELESLRQTLTLTNIALQIFERSPLGQNLRDSVVPQVEEICVVLKELYDRVDRYRKSLWPTIIRDLWRKVLRRGYDVDDGLRSLRVGQQFLGGFLIALNSVLWTELGNGLRAGPESLKYFHSCLRQGPLSLRHIQLQKITVVDHLGRNIPVPIQFCSTWTVFDYIINGYCRDRPGDCFVERGDYGVLRAEDCQMINRSEIASVVEPDMVLEMSIIIHQSTGQDNKGKCPSCRHNNLNATVTNGWTECRKCSGNFQIAAADSNRDYAKKDPPGSAGFGEERDGGDGSISLAGMGDAVKAFTNQRRQAAGHNNGTEFFRLIQVICTGSIVSPDILPTVVASDLPEHARQEDRLLELNSELLKVCMKLQAYGIPLHEPTFNEYALRLQSNLTWLATAADGTHVANPNDVILPIMEPPVPVDFVSTERIQQLYADLPSILAKEIARRYTGTDTYEVPGSEGSPRNSARILIQGDSNISLPGQGYATPNMTPPSPSAILGSLPPGTTSPMPPLVNHEPNDFMEYTPIDLATNSDGFDHTLISGSSWDTFFSDFWLTARDEQIQLR